MAARDVRSRSLRIDGEFAIAGVLTEEHIIGVRQLGRMRNAADVMYSDTASIQSGGALVRTIAGSSCFGRSKNDSFVYVPFMKRSGQNPCVLRVKQLLLVRKQGMGWHNDEARIAVGTLYDQMTVADGAGLETEYNDDPTERACSVPRVLYCSKAKFAEGYEWAVYLRQVHCPLVYLPGGSTHFWVTFTKMGYHGYTEPLEE